MVKVSTVNDDIHMIDALTWVPGYSSVYLVRDEKTALIETGLSTSASIISEGIGSLGVRPEEVAFILVTHVHLDHAGSAGILARQFPRAEVLVHTAGLLHLIDPSRLLSSARKHLGEFGKTYGLDSFIGVEENRVRAVKEGDVIRLGRSDLNILETPGHAPHHIAIHHKNSNGIFVGDGVGVCFAQHNAISPVTPAPNFDMDLCIESINRLKSLDPDVLYFSHFGPAREVDQVLGRAVEKLQAWGRIVLEAAGQRDDLAGITRRICEEMKKDIPFVPGWLHEEMVHVYAAGLFRNYRIDP